MQKFTIKIALFSLFLAIILVVVNQLLPVVKLAPFYFVSIAFFATLTIVVYSMLVKSLKKENKNFITAFYSTTIIRLFGSMFFLLIYLLIEGSNRMNDAIIFIILYFSFIGFEIVNLLPNLRPEIKENKIK